MTYELMLDELTALNGCDRGGTDTVNRATSTRCASSSCSRVVEDDGKAFKWANLPES